MGITPERYRVDDDIARAETLPPEAFTSQEFLARELATLFARSWLLVPEASDEGSGEVRPLAEQCAQRGARVPFSLLGRPLFLQRGWDDDLLRCFPNTCTHAWYPLVLGAGRGNTIVCAQHGRKFDCQGRFLAQPGFGRELPDFPRACDHLPALPVTSWNDWLFANLDPGAAPLGESFAELDASLVRLPLARYARAGAAKVARELAGNWKQYAWNYMDRFHVSFIHRAPGGLADAIEMSSYRTELYAHTALQWAYAQDPEHGFDPEQLPERFRDVGGRRVFALWWFVFPNLTLNFYPWGLSVNLYQPVADRPEATRFLWYQRVLDPAKYARRDAAWLLAQVDAEDVDAMAQVGRGLRSGFAPRGRFAPGEEVGPHWFHRLVARAAFADS